MLDTEECFQYLLRERVQVHCKDLTEQSPSTLVLDSTVSRGPGSPRRVDSCRGPNCATQYPLLHWQQGGSLNILCKAIRPSKDMHSTEVLENPKNLTAFPGLKGSPPFAVRPSLHWLPHTMLLSRAGRSSIHTPSLSAVCLSQKHLCRRSQRCPGSPYPKSTWS